MSVLPAGLSALLGRGRDLRPCDGSPSSGVRRRAGRRPEPLSDIPRRFVGLIEYAFVQTKMFKDWPAGLMHAGIFWGFVLLTIGTANIVTGGLVEQILSIPFDGVLWEDQRDAEHRRGHRPRLHRLGILVRRLITKPRRLTYNRDALIILSMIGGVVLTELLAGVRVRGPRRPAGRVRPSCGRRILRSTLSTQTNETLFAVFWWRTSPWLPRS